MEPLSISPEFWAWLALLAGAVTRVFVPFLQERRADPSLSWSWAYVWPQILGVVIVVITLPITVPNLESVAQVGVQAAFILGVGAAEAGDLTVGKTVRAVIVKK